MHRPLWQPEQPTHAPQGTQTQVVGQQRPVRPRLATITCGNPTRFGLPAPQGAPSPPPEPPVPPRTALHISRGAHGPSRAPAGRQMARGVVNACQKRKALVLFLSRTLLFQNRRWGGREDPEGTRAEKGEDQPWCREGGCELRTGPALVEKGRKCKVWRGPNL